MTITPARVAAMLTLAVALTGCATDSASDAAPEHTTTTGERPAEVDTTAADTGTRDARSRAEQAFINDLSRMGLPTDTAVDTTVEVGVGICQSLADGEEPDVILDRLRPLTSALSAQHSDKDTDAVGRALVDASRSHLCD